MTDRMQTEGLRTATETELEMKECDEDVSSGSHAEAAHRTCITPVPKLGPGSKLIRR